MQNKTTPRHWLPIEEASNCAGVKDGNWITLEEFLNDGYENYFKPYMGFSNQIQIHYGNKIELAIFNEDTKLFAHISGSGFFLNKNIRHVVLPSACTAKITTLSKTYISPPKVKNVLDNQPTIWGQFTEKIFPAILFWDFLLILLHVM